MEPVLDPNFWWPPLYVIIWGGLVLIPVAFFMLAACGWLSFQWSQSALRPWGEMLRWGAAGAVAVAACIVLYVIAYCLVTLAVTLTEGMI